METVDIASKLQRFMKEQLKNLTLHFQNIKMKDQEVS